MPSKASPWPARQKKEPSSERANHSAHHRQHAQQSLDHLQVGGNVVELAFGILFGGIVLTLALAVGLGSRDLVSRSLESRVEHVGERTNIPDDASTASRTIRHF